MLAVVDGEQVEVGRCHPGQARLLRKNGLAEWKDGKILLATRDEALSEEPRYEVGPAWTVFYKLADCPPVFYMDIPPDLAEEYTKSPPQEPWTEEMKATFIARLVRRPYQDLYGEMKRILGFYQVVGDRLFRVLHASGETTCWDESIRVSDGTYTLQGEGRAMDKLYGKSGRCDLLVPSGFPETLKAAERRIAEYLASLHNEAPDALP